MAHLNLLSAQEVESIHAASLRILAETGIELKHAGAQAVLHAHGAVIDKERVRMPPEMVERLLACCPGPVRLRGRDGQVRTLGDGELHWHNMGGAPDIYEPRLGCRRRAVLQDVVDSARILDALEGASTVTPFYTPQDVPGEVMALAMYRHTLPHTLKPVHGPGVQNAAETRFILRMAEVIGNPPEVLALGMSPVSPLTFPTGLVEAIIEIARAGVPFGPLPCPIAGTTAPLSLAGALAQQNAELLACIALAQAVQPGLPVIYTGRLAIMDPRTGLSVWGGVELGLISAGTVALGHRYGLPVNVYGFSTNAHVFDLQNGYERAFNALIPALAGADELSGIGMMETAVMGSHAQMVCDNEIAASVRRLRRGIVVDADALAVDVIASVMDGSRNFLSQRHTRARLKSGEILLTHLADRRTAEVWEREGRDDMAARAQAQAERLLAEHEVEPLTPSQEREYDKIMEGAQRELARQ